MSVGTMNSAGTRIQASVASQKHLARFVEAPEFRMVIHDLRHLVQAIVGSVDTLQMALEEHAADLIDKCLDRLRQNTNLAVDVLGHIGADRQACDQDMTGCDVALEMDLVVGSLDSLLKQNEITMQQRISPCTTVAMRKADLDSLLLNLILNAIEATTKRNASVIITAGTVSGGSVQITVQDNGCGIDKDKLACIFREGYTTKAQRGNKGLGLSIVKHVLETCGGTLRIQSWPGKGTRFVLCLPVTKATRGDNLQ